MVECKKEQNKKICNCSYSCDRKGMCCECLKHHLDNKELPACCFPPEIEKIILFLLRPAVLILPDIPFQSPGPEVFNDDKIHGSIEIDFFQQPAILRHQVVF